MARPGPRQAKAGQGAGAGCMYLHIRPAWLARGGRTFWRPGCSQVRGAAAAGRGEDEKEIGSILLTLWPLGRGVVVVCTCSRGAPFCRAVSRSRPERSTCPCTCLRTCLRDVPRTCTRRLHRVLCHRGRTAVLRRWRQHAAAVSDLVWVGGVRMTEIADETPARQRSQRQAGPPDRPRTPLSEERLPPPPHGA